jgi:glycosyltransferase involved in cell wall biosynthesis
VTTDVEFRPHLSNRIYGYALRKADAICANTSYEVEALSRAFAIPRHRFNLVRLAFLHRDIAASRDENYVVAGGVNGRDWKTFAEAVEALPYEFKVFAKTTGENMPPNVIVKWVSCEDYFRSLEAASCVVLPLLPDKLRCTGTTSWTAAMAMGKVLVVTGMECVSDYIEDGVTGFIVVHGDAAALRSRIKQIMEDAGLRRKVGEAARKRAWRTAGR